MRVALLIDRMQPGRGGAEAALCAFGRHLVSAGAEVHTYGIEGPRDEDEASLAPGEFHNVSSALGVAHKLGTRTRRERAIGAALVQAAKQDKSDVTIGIRHLPEVDLYWPHGGGHLATLEGKVKAKASARGRASEHLTAKPAGRHLGFLEMERGLVRDGRAGGIVCVSEMVRTELQSAYPDAVDPERFQVVSNGVDLEQFAPAERSTLGSVSGLALPGAPDVPVIAFLARAPELKGLPALTRALAGLLDTPWHLVVAGPKSYRSVEMDLARIGQPTSNSGVNRQSERWTYVPDVDPVMLLEASSLVAQPTWRDPCSLATLEALACGRRVLTTLANGASPHVLGATPAPETGAIATSDCGSVIASASDEVALRDALAEELARTQTWSLNDARRVREQAALVPAEVSFRRLEELVRELANG